MPFIVLGHVFIMGNEQKRIQAINFIDRL